MQQPKEKEIVSGAEARKRLMDGVHKVGEVVGSTIGPSGRNVLIGKPFKKPWVTNDGVSVANEITLKDPVADLGVRTLLEVATQTNEKAGDGTSTSIVLAHAIISKGMKDSNLTGLAGKLQGTGDVMKLYRQLKTDSDVIIEQLKDQAKPIKDLEETIQVATSSMEDRELGELIATLVDKTGVNGFINVEEHNDPQTTNEITEGLHYRRMGVAANYALDNDGECVCNTPRLIVTNQELTDTNVTQSLANIMKADPTLQQSPIVIIAPKFSEDVLADFFYTKKMGINIIPIKGGILTDGDLEDVATYCEGVFMNTKVGRPIETIEPTDIGVCDKMIATRQNVTLMGGKGDMTARIKDVQGEIEEAKHESVRRQLEKRLASISGGIGVIKVGGETDTEREYLKLKIEDAINATKAAVEEGVVKGGGQALNNIAKKLDDSNFLKDCITAPYDKIQENAGGSLKIPKEVLDPVKVTRTALENAVSAARTFLTTDHVIVEKAESAATQLVDVLTGVK
jgi:chaperonin GroEL